MPSRKPRPKKAPAADNALSTAANATSLDRQLSDGLEHDLERIASGDSQANGDILVPPTLTITACSQLGQHGGEVVVNVQMPNVTARERPVDLCCVVDISASMAAMAATEENAGIDGLCVLDIVKHSVNTVMHTLRPDDRLCIVAFDDRAEVIWPLSTMDVSSRSSAEVELRQLTPRGQTNLWSGILAGLEALDTNDSTRLGVLMLLTDGKPTISPPRGHLHELKKYKQAHPSCSVQINTFGFGYDLDSDELLDLATEGGGTFAFIPDAPIVGTTFVDSIANVLTTRTLNAVLRITPCSGAFVAGERVMKLGPLCVGQMRQVALHVSGISADPTAPYLEVELCYTDPSGLEVTVSAEGISRQSDANAIAGAYRCRIVQTGQQAVAKASSGRGREAFQQMSRMAESIGTDVPALITLKADVSGRMSKALQGKSRYERWGKHYLRAITRAHELQLCTNFMDVGLQSYGGDLFSELRARGNQIFVGLPPPIATGQAAVVHQPAGQYQYRTPAAPAPAAAPASNSGMDRYMDTSGG